MKTFTKRAFVFTVLVVLFTGCASWFQARVEQRDARIEALEQELRVVTTDEERARIDAAIVGEREDRDRSLEGALVEQKNKQALLMALIALGAGGLRVAVSAAAKGAV